MLSNQDRSKKISCDKHLVQALHERGKKLFPYCSCLNEIYKECIEALKDNQKSVIVSDDREDVLSSHICIFVNGCGEIIALPIAVNEQTIHVFTMKDVKGDFRPNWFIDKYNDVAETRKMQKLPKVIKIS